MNIQTEYIRSLLNKYYDGTSTLEEERQLREYFASGYTDPEFDTDRAVFEALRTPVKVPDSIRRSVEAAIDRNQPKRRVRWWRVGAAAAVLAAAMATGAVFITQRNESQQITPDEARQQTIMALTLLTETMRKGCDAVELGANTAAEGFNTAENTISNL